MTDLQLPPEPSMRTRRHATTATTPPPASMPARIPDVSSPAMRVVGVGGAFGMFLLSMWTFGGHASILLQTSAALLLLGMTLFGLLASHGPRQLGRLVAVVCGDVARDRSEAECLRAMCRRGRRLSYAAGALAVLVGTIHVLSVLDQPHMVGPGFAVALIGLLLAVLVAELGFGAAEHWVQETQA